jgi:hypothetical protein
MFVLLLLRPALLPALFMSHDRMSGVMKCFFFCRQQGSQSLMLTDTGQHRSCPAALPLFRLRCMPLTSRSQVERCFRHASDSLAVVDMSTGRCETTAKLESPALEAAFRATFGQLLSKMS